MAFASPRRPASKKAGNDFVQVEPPPTPEEKLAGIARLEDYTGTRLTQFEREQFKQGWVRRWMAMAFESMQHPVPPAIRGHDASAVVERQRSRIPGPAVTPASAVRPTAMSFDSPAPAPGDGVGRALFSSPSPPSTPPTTRTPRNLPKDRAKMWGPSKYDINLRRPWKAGTRRRRISSKLTSRRRRSHTRASRRRARGAR